MRSSALEDRTEGDGCRCGDGTSLMALGDGGSAGGGGTPPGDMGTAKWRLGDWSAAASAALGLLRLEPTE